MYTAQTFQKLAEEISQEYVEKGTPLNGKIKSVSVELQFNPEQIKRLVETTNITTYNKLFNTLQDKTFKFELGDSKKVIEDIYHTESPKTEIKDMAPVQYSAPSDQILGDKNELEEAKGKSLSDAKSGKDSIRDNEELYTPPKKDYVTPLESTVEEYESKNTDSSDEGTQSEEDKEKEKESFKTASKKEGDLRTIKDELKNRKYILEDKLAEEYHKLAMMFSSIGGREKFVDFKKHASALYQDNDYANKAMNLISNLPALRNYRSLDAKPVKIASLNAYGLKNFIDLVDTQKSLIEVEKTLDFLRAN